MTNTNRSHLRIRALCEGAVMVALAQALSHVKFMTLPNGGSLTPALFPILFLPSAGAWVRACWPALRLACCS